MRVLHLFSNHKWTGPAEPCLTLCRSLSALGVSIDFACGSGSDPAKNKVAAMAKAWGMPPLPGFRLDKHQRPIANWQDGRRLRRLLTEQRYDVLHSHLDNDHRIALKPAREAGIPLVRSSYEGEGTRKDARHDRLLRDTAWLFEPSEIAATHDAEHFAFPRARMSILPGSVDLQRFNPDRELPDARARMGIPAKAFTVGIVARMQTHRHYEDLFTAFHQLLASHPDARLVVIGRGTKQEEVGYAPVCKLGIESNVVFTGYLDGEDYVATLRALDAGVFLVPGSDGTCRAVRELLAMGVPMAVADRGMLREIVRHGVTGAVFDGSSAGLTQVLNGWASDPQQRLNLAAAAHRHAVAHFDPELQAREVIAVYERVIAEAEARR